VYDLQRTLKKQYNIPKESYGAGLTDIIKTWEENNIWKNIKLYFILMSQTNGVLY
jgi:hypothetical protein